MKRTFFTLFKHKGIINIVATYSPLPRYSIPHKIRLFGKWKLQLMIYCHFLSNPNRDLWVCQLFSSQTSCLQKIATIKKLQLGTCLLFIITALEIIALMSLCTLHFYQLSYQCKPTGSWSCCEFVIHLLLIVEFYPLYHLAFSFVLLYGTYGTYHNLHKTNKNAKL